MQLDLCYVLATLTLFKLIYFAYFHSLMKYGIIFWSISLVIDCPRWRMKWTEQKVVLQVS
jgi:hypothetical protein